MTQANRTARCRSQTQSHLLSLPPELRLAILAYLPLSALFIYHFQLCLRLRIDACSQYPHESGYGLELRNGYWSLAEHRQAAQEARQLCGVQQQYEQQQQLQPQKGTSSVKDGPETSPDADARLALRALRYTGLIGAALPAPSQKRSHASSSRNADAASTSSHLSSSSSSSQPLPPPRLSQPPTSISLIGARGVDGRLVKQLLREPRLAAVKTIVKTGRLDKPIHEVRATAPPLAHRSDYYLSAREAEAAESARRIATLSDATSSWALGLDVGRSTSIHAAPQDDADDESEQRLPEVTQAVCIAGSKLSEGETIRGQGIQMGFEALCFVSSAPLHASTTSAKAKSTLHIILEGAYDLQGAMEMERLFASSRLQCRQCGNVIEFG